MVSLLVWAKPDFPAGKSGFFLNRLLKKAKS
jgi:hypothetical protein